MTAGMLLGSVHSPPFRRRWTRSPFVNLHHKNVEKSHSELKENEQKDTRASKPHFPIKQPDTKVLPEIFEEDTIISGLRMYMMNAVLTEFSGGLKGNFGGKCGPRTCIFGESEITKDQVALRTEISEKCHLQRK